MAPDEQRQDRAIDEIRGEVRAIRALLEAQQANVEPDRDRNGN